MYTGDIFAPQERTRYPEDNTICPLTRLGLLKERRNERIIKTPPCPDELPIEVVYLVMKDACNAAHVNVVSLFEDANNLGRVFNLSLDTIYTYLERLQEQNLLSFSRTAGIDSVTLSEVDPWSPLQDKYQRMFVKGVNPDAAQ